MNAGQSFADIDNLQQTVPYGGSQFTADVISASSIFNSDLNNLQLYLLHQNIRSQ